VAPASSLPNVTPTFPMPRSLKGLVKAQLAVNRLRSLTPSRSKSQTNDADQDLGLFTVDPAVARATQEAWAQFIATFESVDNAGEAIYVAIFESAPALQSLFSQPKTVQAVKFGTALTSLINTMTDAPALKVAVETLGFQHLHVEVTNVRLAVFRDSIVELIDLEMEGKLSEEVSSTLVALMTYVGKGIMFVKTHHGERLKILTASWAALSAKPTAAQEAAAHEDSESDEGGSESPSNPLTPKTKTGRSLGNMLNGGSGSKNDSGELKGKAKTKSVMPTTFDGMFRINSAVMGFNKSVWMYEVLESFDGIVSNVSNSNRVKEETDVLALKIAKHPQESINLPDFKACMLATLRSLLLKQWTSVHEEAWSWMWENIARMLLNSLPLPPRYETALSDFLDSCDERKMFEMRKAIYTAFFHEAPVGQDYFVQSNSRLHFIAERVIAMTLEIYHQPRRLVAEISVLGLRHVGFGIPTELFSPFVTACVAVLQDMGADTLAVEAYRWSLGLVAKILVRMIQEGSTVVMKAINANSQKQLKKALSGAPRGNRSSWLLDVQVGDQHISPLSIAIENRSIDVAQVILKDLLTIRADRDRYYYGVDELFRRHTDIIKVLCEDAPMLLTTLLEGLIWRSHRPDANGMRRVNYYVKHLLIDNDGNFSDALRWLTANGDPGIISSPVVVLVSDSLWRLIVYKQFMIEKLRDIVSVVVFVLTQGILPNLDGGNQRAIGWCILFGRTFTYVFVMGRQSMTFCVRIWTWSRNEMRRIFEEIDTDHNGTIDWSEFIQASTAFKQSVQNEIDKALKIFRDDDSLASMQEDRKAIAQKGKTMNTVFEILLMLLLAVMFFCEPMLLCFDGSLEEWPTNSCPNADPVKYQYSILSMSGVVIHWFTLGELAVLSTQVSAFLLVCSHVMADVVQFLTALSFLILMFGSAITILCRECSTEAGDFTDMANAMVSLFSVTLGFYEGDWRQLQEEPPLLLAIFIFVMCSSVLLLNLLIAQLNLSYEYVAQDMLGFARLHRASLIVEQMAACTKEKWEKTKESLKLDQPIEFDEGDLGISGGIPVPELASLNRCTRESIIRYGGSTSPEAPWPEDKTHSANELSQLDRIEVAMLKTLKHISKEGRDGHVAGGADTPSSGSNVSLGSPEN